MTYREHDTVVLTADLPKHGLRAGDVGTVVYRHDDTNFEVEFTSANGECLAVLTLGTAQLRLAVATDIMAVRTA